MESETHEQPTPDEGEAPPAVDKPAEAFEPDEAEASEAAEEAEELLEAEPDEERGEDKAAPHAGAAVSISGRRVAIGVDIGGSGIKAAAVDLDTGELVSQRHRVPTPQPSAPAAVIASIARLVKRIGA